MEKTTTPTAKEKELMKKMEEMAEKVASKEEEKADKVEGEVEEPETKAEEETEVVEPKELLNENEEDESRLLSVNVLALIAERAEEKNDDDRPGEFVYIHKGAKFQEISFFQKDERTRIAISLDKQYVGPKKDRDTEEWSLGRVNVLYTFPSLLRRALLKCNSINVKRLVKRAMKDEELLNELLMDCGVIFAVESVLEGEVYVNPISGREADYPAEYETRYTHLLSVQVTEAADQFAKEVLMSKYSK